MKPHETVTFGETLPTTDVLLSQQQTYCCSVTGPLYWCCLTRRQLVQVDILYLYCCRALFLVHCYMHVVPRVHVLQLLSSCVTRRNALFNVVATCYCRSSRAVMRVLCCVRLVCTRRCIAVQLYNIQCCLSVCCCTLHVMCDARHG